MSGGKPVQGRKDLDMFVGQGERTDEEGEVEVAGQNVDDHQTRQKKERTEWGAQGGGSEKRYVVMWPRVSVFGA